MYKAILVDDEEEVRSGIATIIDWGKSGFFVPRQAENGREALDLIEEDVPDVVITDITMPLMNGLELASVIRERFPTVKTAILTGFDDFRFAQQAIHYGVAEYLLKPVLPSDIDSLLAKLKTQLDNEAAEREDMDRLRSVYQAAQPILREKYLSSLVCGSAGTHRPWEGSPDLRVNLHGGPISAAAIRVDDPIPEGSAFAGVNSALAPIAVLDTARDVLNRLGAGEAFLHEGSVAVLLGFDQETPQAVENKVIQVLEEIRQTVEKFHKFTVTIGLGGVISAPDRIRECYGAALTALEYRIVTGGNRVICHRDIELGPAETLSFDEGRERVFASLLKFGSAKEVTDGIDLQFHDLSQMRAAPTDQRLFFLELFAAIARVARAYGLEPQDMLGAGQDPYAQLTGLDTPEKARKWFTALSLAINRRIRGIHQASGKSILGKAREYIQAHYADDDLTAQKLADHLHISASYLNMIFKKEAGESFLKHLVRVRLEAASSLLAGSDLKTAEIAERIGYPDINYFSYFFKKHYGVSPREYRNQMKAKRDNEP